MTKLDFSGEMQWTQTYAIEFYSGDQCPEGGFVLVGHTSIVKTDENGAIQWERNYNEVGLNTKLKSVKQSNDGGYILAGWSNPTGVNNNDFLLIKTDSKGNIDWRKTYGDELANELAYDVLQDSDGGYIIVGEKFRFDSFWTDGWVVKTDLNGNLLWSKTYEEPDPRGDWLYSVSRTKDGDFIIAGCANRDPENNWQTGDFWLLQIDNLGNLEWSRLFGEHNRYESASSVKETNDGCFIAIGDIRRGGAFGDNWIIKTNPSDS